MASIYSLLWDSNGVIEESMMEEEYIKPPGMLLFSIHSETYHTLLSSITQDDICVYTLLADYQKST
jgi:hypothetical protein